MFFVAIPQEFHDAQTRQSDLLCLAFLLQDQERSPWAAEPRQAMREGGQSGHGVWSAPRDDCGVGCGCISGTGVLRRVVVGVVALNF